MTEQETRVYISQLALELNRREGTVRGWCRERSNGSPRLPQHLMPVREKTERGDGWRYWTLDQVEGIKIWMVEQKMLPGAGLRNYDPNPDEVDDLLAKLRGRKRSRPAKRKRAA